MRIALVSEHASPLAVLGGVDAGGQNVHVANLARELGARGHEVVVYTRRDDLMLPRRVRLAPNVIVEHLDAGPTEPISKDVMLAHMDEMADGLRHAWRRWLPDVVHSHFWMSAYAALRAREGLMLPLAHTFHALGHVRRRHQGSADASPRERVEIEREIVASADWLVCTSRDEVAELRRLGAGPERMSVIPCGVDLDIFRPDGEKWAVPPPAGMSRVVVLSRLVPRKGVDDVIRALALLSHEEPGPELLIAGGPPRASLESDDEVRRLIRVAIDVGVRDRVRFLGRVERTSVPALLRSADVAVSAPWYEPFGIVPLEAMACGVPVVGTAVGGLLDTIADGVTGFLVPPREPAMIADRIARLLGDGELRKRLGAAGAVRAKERYGWAQVTSSTLDAYERMLGQARGAAEETW